MAQRVNPNWIRFIEKSIENHEKIDKTTSYNKAAQILIKMLVSQDIPFKVYNLGAGIKRITTNTETCPCCKRKL